MKRVVVVGCPGSGKSTFSKKLHGITGIPLYHLDNLFWNEDKTTVKREIFLERLEKVLETDSWIIDGNYASTMEMRIKRCDTVIFLDYPLDVCLSGIKERMGKPRSDIPWVETEHDEDFERFIKDFPYESRQKITSLLAKYNKNTFVFKSREEANAFLTEIDNVR